MPREIKFRAWLVEDSKMYNWNPRFFSDMSPVTSWSEEFPDGRDVILMQFTGLYDKNGREIYEYDIIFQWTGNNLSPRRGKGKYEKGIVEVVKEYVNGGCWEPIGSGLIAGHKRPNWEVIGNIYESPDLIP